MSWPSTRPLTAGNAFRASIAALTKNDMKPRATPCLALKASLYLPRRSMIRDMSASLKVVRIAAVCWASTSRWAIFWRMPLIRLRVSRGGRPRRRRGGGGGCRARGRGRGGGAAAPRRRRRGRGEVGDHVALGDPAAAAGPLDLRRVDVLLGDDPADGRRERGVAVAGRAGRGRRRRRRALAAAAGCGGAGAAAAAGRAGGVDRADGGADLDGRPLGDADLQDAGRRRPGRRCSPCRSPARRGARPT